MRDVRIENLTFSYNGSDKIVLEDINLEIGEGEFVCILGQSGCGKSTMLRLLAGLEHPTRGQIVLDGKLIKGASLERSVVFQDYGMFPWKSAGENILLALRQKYPKEKKSRLKEIALDAIRDVGLKDEVFDMYPKQLSGGMQQRCAIARSFSIDPPFLLMDEPFGALDAVTRSKLQDMILRLWEKDEDKKTVFFVTHDVDEAILLGTRILVLGQSPSHIIYDHKFKSGEKPAREQLYDDSMIIDLRNKLIKFIHQDVASRRD